MALSWYETAWLSSSTPLRSELRVTRPVSDRANERPERQGWRVALAGASAAALLAYSRPRRRAARATGSTDTSTASQSAPSTVLSKPVAQSRTGVLLLNIGTPSSPEIREVRSYLEKFLRDDRIKIDDPVQKELALQRILETRPQIAAESYRKIWDAERGAPLLFHTLDLRQGLQQELGEGFIVELGFQYSEPSVDKALRQLLLAGADHVVLASMFPHYATATTGGCLSSAYKKAVDYFSPEQISVIEPFYKTPSFLDSIAHEVTHALGPQLGDFEHLLFSFHGMAEDQEAELGHADEYRKQCFETARLTAGLLGIDGRWSVSFQSRPAVRGTANWIQPHTDQHIINLAKSGLKRLAVVAPSYTVDCLETLEELAMLGQEQFRSAGGEHLKVVPCLNGSDHWVASFASILRQHWLDLARVVLMQVVSSLQ